MNSPFWNTLSSPATAPAGAPGIRFGKWNHTDIILPFTWLVPLQSVYQVPRVNTLHLSLWHLDLKDLFFKRQRSSISALPQNLNKQMPE